MGCSRYAYELFMGQSRCCQQSRMLAMPRSILHIGMCFVLHGVDHVSPSKGKFCFFFSTFCYGRDKLLKKCKSDHNLSEKLRKKKRQAFRLFPRLHMHFKYEDGLSDRNSQKIEGSITEKTKTIVSLVLYMEIVLWPYILMAGDLGNKTNTGLLLEASAISPPNFALIRNASLF